MSSIIWLYIVVGFFALIGVSTFVRGVITVSRYVVFTANNLVSTLKDATEIARAYREDLGILRQIAQSGVDHHTGDEPESIIPEQAHQQAPMPPPYWPRYPIKPEEPEAPLESIRDVDMTSTDEDFIEQEKNAALSDFEAQERQKAKTREADQARLREMTDLSGGPEGK